MFELQDPGECGERERERESVCVCVWLLHSKVVNTADTWNKSAICDLVGMEGRTVEEAPVSRRTATNWRERGLPWSEHPALLGVGSDGQCRQSEVTGRHGSHKVLWVHQLSRDWGVRAPNNVMTQLHTQHCNLVCI